jgi:hypothetical protein
MGDEGANPCATITALAERSCELVIQERGWKVDESSNGILDLSGYPPFTLSGTAGKRPARVTSKDSVEGVQFDETMQGHIHIGSDGLDFEAAEKVARMASSSAQLVLTVKAFRTGDGSYYGVSSGTFACGALSQDPLLVTGGTVDFFTVDADVADAVNLVYKLDLLATSGAKYAFHGYKRLDSAATFSVSRTWSATTTLFTTITGSDGSVIARGILRISIRNFISELRSFRSSSSVDTLSTLYAQARFLKFFVTDIALYMFSPFRTLHYPTPPTDRSGYYEKPTPTVGILTADDGVQFPLKMWHPPLGIPEKRTPIVLIPGASVDDRIFSLPTVSTNAIDYFTSLGYRCYVPVVRFGMGEDAKKGDTVYDARLDVRATMKYVREREKEKQIYVVVHCLGSIAMGIALLTGDVEASWIKGMTCSQVFINLIFNPDNAFKARHPLLIKTYNVRSSPPLQMILLTDTTDVSRRLASHPLLTLLLVGSIPSRPTSPLLPRRQQNRTLQFLRLPQMRRPLRSLLDALQPQPRHTRSSRPFLRRHTHELPLPSLRHGRYTAASRPQQPALFRGPR